jgi:serine/threonine protein phosphatase 1
MSLLARLLTREVRTRPAPRIDEGVRIYAIGDIHGRADLLAQLAHLILLDIRAAPPSGRALVVFLGDYIDRGMDSRGVLDALTRSAFKTQAVFLRGNHEAMMLAFLDDVGAGPGWIQNGGLETLHSYGIDTVGLRTGGSLETAQSALRDALPPTHLDFLLSTRLTFTSGDYFFCHAGARPGRLLTEQVESDLLWIREEFLDSRADFGFRIVHGHTPVMQPEVRPNRINIDTGAYISGKLTCVVLEGELLRFLQTSSSVERLTSE